MRVSSRPPLSTRLQPHLLAAEGGGVGVKEIGISIVAHVVGVLGRYVLSPSHVTSVLGGYVLSPSHVVSIPTHNLVSASHVLTIPPHSFLSPSPHTKASKQ